MLSNQISPFEYVSILVSIILGLGITQILSAFSDLLYDFKKVKFYWPHSLWIAFIFFLHIQDWFITWQLRNKMVWHLPELFFILMYPVSLFIAAKILIPSHDKDESEDMKMYYQNQFPMLFFIVGISILISIFFNIFFLEKPFVQQFPLFVFLLVMFLGALRKIENELFHKMIALIVCLAALLSVVLEQNIWVIQ